MEKGDYEHYLTTVEKSVRENWQHKAVSNYGETVSYTYGEMAMEVERVKEWMNHMGIRQGDKVAICGRSSAQWAITYLSIVTCRCTAVSILPGFTPDIIKFLVEHSDAKLLMVGNIVESKIAGMDFGDTIVVNMEQWRVLNGTAEQIGSKCSEGRDEFLSHLDWHTGMSEDDLALINYTSGTTANPKGVIIPSRALSSNVDFGQRTVKNGPGDQIVGMLPLAHIFGIMFDFLYQIAGGVHIVYLNKAPAPSTLLKAFSEVQPYMILTVPLMIEKIVKTRILPVMNRTSIKMMWAIPNSRHIVRDKINTQLMNTFGGKLRELIIGGAALNPEVDKCLSKLRFPYDCGYGMTETAPLITYAHPEQYKTGSVGRSVDNIEIRIMSKDPEHTAGEILVRGDNLFTGYYKNERATREAFDDGGWFHTGDMGTIDSEGNISLRGRNKTMILGSNGQNIYPEEIEAKLQTMPRVVESLVIQRDNQIIALVYPDREGITSYDLRMVMGDNLVELNLWLPRYAQVAKIELVDKEFEKTPKASIKRYLYK